MSAWQKFHEVGRRLRSPMAANKRSNLADDPIAGAEEQQLELLLEEVRDNEQRLGVDHWTALAAAFRDRCDTEVTGAKDPKHQRMLQRSPATAAHALPLGGLLAAAALILAQTAFNGGATTTLANDNHRAVAAPLRTGETRLAAAATQPDEPTEAAVSAARATAHPVTPSSLAPEIDSVEPTPDDEAIAPAVARYKAQRRAVGVAPATAAMKEPEEPQLVREGDNAPSKAIVRTASAPEDTFAAQLSALKRADKALKFGNPADARSALAGEFSPQLALHARALRVILACQDGSTQLGRRALASQQARYPNSPYLARMRRACGVAEPE